MNNEQYYVDITEKEATFLRAYQTFIKDTYDSLDETNTISDGYFIFNKVHSKFWKCKYIFYESTSNTGKVFDPGIMINIKFFNKSKYTAGIKEDYVYELKTTKGSEPESFLKPISSEKDFYEKEKAKKNIFVESFAKEIS